MDISHTKYIHIHVQILKKFLGNLWAKNNITLQNNDLENSTNWVVHKHNTVDSVIQIRGCVGSKPRQSQFHD